MIISLLQTNLIEPKRVSANITGRDVAAMGSLVDRRLKTPYNVSGNTPRSAPSFSSMVFTLKEAAKERRPDVKISILSSVVNYLRVSVKKQTVREGST